MFGYAAHSNAEGLSSLPSLAREWVAPSPSNKGPLQSGVELAADLKIAYIAVLHDVVLALLADLAMRTSLSHGAGVYQVIEGNDLGLNELLFKIGVDDSSCLRCGRALLNGPRTGLLLPGGEVGLQPQGGKTCLSQGG